MVTQKAVDHILAQQTLAIAGISRSGEGYGNKVFKNLTAKGYEILPVHPSAGEVAGVEAYRSLGDLPETVGGLILVVPPPQTEILVEKAKETGIERIWMQPGAESAAAVRFCEDNDIEVVHDQCIMVLSRPRVST